MSRPAKIKPIVAFQENLEDAEQLIKCANMLTTKRKRRMRVELRRRIGEALRVKKADWDNLECIETERVFILFRNSQDLSRSEVDDTRPLLRQAIVAGCAAMETYLADKAIDCISSVLKFEQLPRRMLNIPLTVEDYLRIDDRYTRRAWGLRLVLQDAIRNQASTAPNQVGAVLSMIGVKDWSRNTDKLRRLEKGATEEQLKAITKRRNAIAHNADRSGSRRASLTIDETLNCLEHIKQIAHALDSIIDAQAKT